MKNIEIRFYVNAANCFEPNRFGINLKSHVNVEKLKEPSNGKSDAVQDLYKWKPNPYPPDTNLVLWLYMLVGQSVAKLPFLI